MAKQGADQTDRSRAVVDSAAVRARRGQTGPKLTDKAGSKHHLITDARGVPLATILTGVNAHDVIQLLPLAEAIPQKATVAQAHELLAALVPPRLYYRLHLNLIEHGRAICHARQPHCAPCPLKRVCEYYERRQK